MCKSLKDTIHIQRITMPNDEELLKSGEFLTEKEFKKLVDGIFKRINRLIEIYNKKSYLTYQVNFIL